MPGVFADLGDGVICIDADYVERGMACFYLVGSGGEYAVIETGTNHSLANLETVLQDRGIRPEQVRFVIPTHVHLDHAGGAGSMMQRFPEAQLLIHPRGARHMADPGKLIAASEAVYGEALFRELYGAVVAVDPERMRTLEDGETVDLGRRRLQFRHTEGHARHHFCVWDETSGGWFSGDMFGLCYPWFRFAGGDFVMPSTTPTQFDPDAFLHSLDLLAQYRPRRIYLTHYGALRYTADKAQQLAEQVADYRDLALGASADLASALEDYSLRRIRAFDSITPEQELRHLLQFDVSLNAQGLAHWRQQA